MERLRPVCVLLALAIVTPLASGTKSKVWQQNEARHYERAVMQRVVLSAEGAVRLSRPLVSMASLDVSHIWAVAAEKDGFLYAATGSQGKLYKISPQGEVSLAYQSKDSQMLSLAVTANGTVYAGTGPSGTIVKLTPEGDASVFVQTSESYVWALAWDEAKQELYAGTGPQGRIYRIRANGEMTLHYTTRQEHVLCLAMGPQGTVYAGTGQKGVVYRIDGKGQGTVMLEVPQPEVKTLLVRGETIYVGTSSPHRRNTAARTSGGGGTQVGMSGAVTEPQTADSKPPSEQGSVRVNSSTKPIPAPTLGGSSLAVPGMAPPSGKENSVYRLTAQGSVREVFRIKAMITCLAEKNGKLLIGTGATGQIFEMNEEERDFTELTRVEEGHILGLCPQADGWLVATGDPGKLYTFRHGYAKSGSVISEVYDAKSVSKWGAIRWKGETPRGTSLSVAVRSGNVAEPDDTWSAWSDEETNPVQATAKAPPGRYLQYRVTLQTDDTTVSPTFRGVEIRYQQVNQAPVLGVIEIVPPEAGPDKPKRLRIRWTAADSNEDELLYTVSLRKEGWPQWVEIASDVDKPECEWDATALPSGTYQVRVTASDRKDNAEEEALTDTRTSANFVLDQTPPAVTIKAMRLDGDRAVIDAEAKDEHSALASAMISVDGQKWTNVFPTDGLFDDKQKKFHFKTPPLKPGTHVVVLRVVDAAGNTGATDTVFEVRVKTLSAARLNVPE
jgi:outer membrane protein assembly factor BamB